MVTEQTISVRQVEHKLSEGELPVCKKSQVKKEDIPLDAKGMPIFNNQLG